MPSIAGLPSEVLFTVLFLAVVAMVVWSRVFRGLVGVVCLFGGLAYVVYSIAGRQSLQEWLIRGGPGAGQIDTWLGLAAAFGGFVLLWLAWGSRGSAV